MYDAGSLTAADLANVTCAVGAAGTTASLGADGKSIVVHFVPPSLSLVWNGTQANWGDVGAWDDEATSAATTWTDGATLAFNFTEKAVPPVLAVTAGAKPTGAVNVRLAGEIPTPGAYVLTQGGGFDGDGVAVNLVGKPKGTKLRVNYDGNLEISVSPGLIITFR